MSSVHPFESLLRELAAQVAEGHAAQAGRRYDQAVRELRPDRLPERVEALRRAVTDLIAGAELRAEFLPTWVALAQTLAHDDDAPLREHLAALDAAGQLAPVLSELRAVAPDTWPWLEQAMPSGWTPARRELSPDLRWIVTGGLIVAVLGFLFVAAYLLS